jgi:hypothetical protein
MIALSAKRNLCKMSASWSGSLTVETHRDFVDLLYILFIDEATANIDKKQMK